MVQGRQKKHETSKSELKPENIQSKKATKKEVKRLQEELTKPLDEKEEKKEEKNESQIKELLKEVKVEPKDKISPKKEIKLEKEEKAEKPKKRKERPSSSSDFSDSYNETHTEKPVKKMKLISKKTTDLEFFLKLNCCFTCGSSANCQCEECKGYFFEKDSELHIVGENNCKILTHLFKK